VKMPSDVTIGSVVVPGDNLDHLLSEDHGSAKLVIGPGLRRYSESVIATKCGVLRKKSPHTYWIDCHQKKYDPVQNECVIGIVTSKLGDMFKVDIGASEHALLSFLAFEGATKKNRPIVAVGDILYAKLSLASPYMEPELVCVDAHGKKSGMGVLGPSGFLFRVSLHYARKLLSSECNLLKLLGCNDKYEITIGMNGRVWLKGRNVDETLAIMKVILDGENMNDDELKVLCSRIKDKAIVLISKSQR